MGNNDFKSHNIFFEGPNFFTRAFDEVWGPYIPQDQHTTFQKGAYFSKEVIADDLAVLSLNTMYWYDANAAVRGCKGRDDPGSIELDWMEETLHRYHNRSMQVHLMGHVPPTTGNYFSDCYDRYTEIVLRYQDTVVGQHYGHMNVDAWFLQEDVSLSLEGKGEEMTSLEQGDVYTQSFPSGLRKDFDTVPTKQKTNSDAYSAFFVSPSIVPTYLPTVRVWTYNATRPLEKQSKLQSHSEGRHTPHEQLAFDETVDLTLSLDDSVSNFFLNFSKSAHTSGRSHRRPRKGKKKHRKHKDLPRHTSPDSPSRRNTYLTMLGYSQWVLDLDGHNRRYRKEAKKGKEHSGLEYQLEYTTYEAKTLWSEYLETNLENNAHVPVPRQLLDKELSRLNARSPSLALNPWFINPFVKAVHNKVKKVKVPRKLRHLTNYSIPSFTVDHLLEWARELAGNNVMWKSFLLRIYSESGSEG